MWADRFPEKVVVTMEEDLGEYGSAGQLQQRPVPLGGGILKKKWWKVWGKTPETKNLPFPQPLHVVCSMDTALSERDLKENAFSAATIWSVFEIPGPSSSGPPRYGMLLLDTWHKRAGYPELREKTLAIAKKHLSFEKGDAILVESKASGISLIQDLRRNRRLFVRGYDPRPDGDKVARCHFAAPHVKAGTVYIPDKTWAHTLVNIVSEFPAGGPPCSDLTDTVTQAIRYVTKRRWIEHPDDRDDDFEEIEDAQIVSAYG